VLYVLLQMPVQFVKPVQTGYPQDSDSRLVVSTAYSSTSSSCKQPFNIPGPYRIILPHEVLYNAAGGAMLAARQALRS
jgi:hypothetical protein